MRLPDNIFQERLRLAAPPLAHEWPADEVRQFVPNITDPRAARDIVRRFHGELKPLCDEVCGALRSIRPGHGRLDGFARTDAEWFANNITRLESNFKGILEHGNDKLQIMNAEALKSRLKADVEEYPGDWRARPWRDVASLHFIDTDMLAWRLYCRDPTGRHWRSEMAWLSLDDRASLDEHRQRVERGRPGEFALAKREFVPVGRREAARW